MVVVRDQHRGHMADVDGSMEADADADSGP